MDDKMRRSAEQRRNGGSVLVVLLFFCGIIAIVIGLWLITPALSLIFLGLALLYLAACVSKVVNSTGKDDMK